MRKPWSRSLKRRRAQEIQVITVSAKEPVRSRLSCQELNRYFSEVVGALSKAKSPEQMFNMDGSGVRARRFKGKRRQLASLIMRPVQPYFQDIRDVSHVSVVGAVALGVNSVSPLFLMALHINSRDSELCTMPGDLQPSI
jgi:hypothetical protein